jgi:hypothetical protein|tara:strand:+ start:36 stop:965 length:930 start_codon:yes stop_codon:yes gene_type:complete
MADRSIALTNTLNDFRRELNGTAADVGDIADVLSASGFIASATDVVEAIVLINTELPEIKTDAFIFPGRVMAFEGATDDAFETTITFTEPTGDRTHTLPDSNGSILLETNSDTSTNKTFTSPTITSPVLDTGVSGTAFLDEDNMASDSDTKLASQQSIKAYVDNQIDTDMDLVFAGDSGSGQITMDSETITFSGGTNISTAASGNTVTMNLSSNVVRDDATQTLTNKTFTSPVINAMTFSSGQTTAGLNIGVNGIIFEGSTADNFETTLLVTNPTADNTITIPDASMTALTTATHANKFQHIVRVIALG